MPRKRVPGVIPTADPNALERIGGDKAITLWGLTTTHTLSDAMRPEFYRLVETHGLRTGDWVFVNASEEGARQFAILAVLSARRETGVEVVCLSRVEVDGG